MIGDGKDVGFAEDFMFYLQSAVSLEHHCLITYTMTKKNIYLQMAEKIRRNRSKWMYLYIPESKGQVYCISKHLMQGAQSLKEMGNRFVEKKETKLAEECFKESQECEAMFILLNEDGGKNV